MIITTQEIVNQKNLTGHIILHCLGQVPEILQKVSEYGQADIQITIDGQKIDYADFIAHWESQVDQMIDNRAVEIVENKRKEDNEWQWALKTVPAILHQLDNDGKDMFADVLQAALDVGYKDGFNDGKGNGNLS